MTGLRLGCLLAAVAAATTLLATSAWAATTTTIPCTQAHPCHHVFHLGTNASPDKSHIAWDSSELLPAGQIAVLIRYSPALPTDSSLRLDPVGDCALHFQVAARFTGFATHCEQAAASPLHVLIANVHKRHLRVGIYYWVPTPAFTG